MFILNPSAIVGNCVLISPVIKFYLNYLALKGWTLTFAYGPRQVNFQSGQVDFVLLLPTWQVTKIR